MDSQYQFQQPRNGDVGDGFGSDVGTKSYSPTNAGIVSRAGEARHHPLPISIAHDLDPELASLTIDLDESNPLPLGWQKILDLKTGEIYYKKDTPGDCNEDGKYSRLDLKLNLSPTRLMPQVEVGSSKHPVAESPSWVPSEINIGNTLQISNLPEATSRVLVGCQHCHMYAMTSVEDPKCPNCKGTALIDFSHGNNAN